MHDDPAMAGEAAILAIAERIAQTHGAAAVTQAEEQAKANAIMDGLRGERVLSLLVPPSFGGQGLTITSAARVVAAIATASGSAGLICAMHFGQLAALIRHGKGDIFTNFLHHIADQQILIASGTSEVGVGGDILKSLCRTTPQGDRYGLVKDCANISYLDQAGAILVTALHSERGRDVQRLILVESPGLTIRVNRESQLMGMRGIVNRAVTITGSFRTAAIFPEPFTVIARTMSAASHILWAAVWSGIATAAVEKAEAADGAPGTACRLGAAYDRLYAMNALIRDASRAFDTPTTAGSLFQVGSRFNSLKISCADMLTDIISDCAAVAGFAGYIEGTRHSLSEVIRDSFSARIMVSNDRLAGANATIRRLVRERI